MDGYPTAKHRAPRGPCSVLLDSIDRAADGLGVLDEEFAATLAAAQSGHRDAFAVLWRDAQPMLLRYLKVLAPELAEDVAAEAWLEVIGQLGTFRGEEAGFRGWLVTIARHKLIDHQRRAARRPERLLESFDTVGHPAAPDAAEVAAERLSTEDALRLIAELPAEVAEMVALRVLIGLDVAEVAKIVGRKPGAVRVAVHRGLRRLAARLAEGDVTLAPLAAFPGRDD
jgi:RNA polymerase sigma-70 factor (ECF subfamily)